jgi:hypothetical protein
MEDRARRGPRNVETTSNGARSGSGRWLRVGLIVICALILVFWLVSTPGEDDLADGALPATSPADDVATGPDAGPDTPEGNDVEEITDESPLPMDDADPNAVVPQDAVIPPAPVREAPPQ